MSWWGGNPYENDTARDWIDGLLREGGHPRAVESTLERALACGLPGAWRQADAFAAVAAALVVVEARAAPAPALEGDRSVERLRAWAATAVAQGRAGNGGDPEFGAQFEARLDRLAASAASAGVLVRAATLDGRHCAQQADDSRAASLATLDAIDGALGCGATAAAPGGRRPP